MINRRILAAAVLGVGAVALIGIASHAQPRPAKSAPSTAPREADAEAVMKTARDFAAAFNARDAKAVAAQWTENGECHPSSGEVLHGRAAIEKAYAELFKTSPDAKIEIIPHDVRFPASDIAIEEGLVRLSRGDKELPTSSAYSVVHAREGGKWLAAVSKEWGDGIDRLLDLEWLLGDWKASSGTQSMTLSFKRDPKRPFINGSFTRKDGDKEISSGTIRLERDPEMQRIRSWHFDNDGGHGQALWVRDGNRWVLDSRAVLGDGTQTASLNIIGRAGPDAITWQSIDRVMGGKALPNTAPVRLTKSNAKR